MSRLPEHEKRLTTGDIHSDIMAAYNYVDSVIDTADDKIAIMWHGWALREAFLAGISYKEKGEL